MDDLKISFFEEREINVYEKKGTVVCRMKGFFDEQEIVGYGVARCKAGDTFDVEKGKRIATAIAENEVYKNAMHIARQWRMMYRDQKKHVEGILDAYSRFIEKGEKTFTHNWDYIKRVDEGKVTSRKNK